MEVNSLEFSSLQNLNKVDLLFINSDLSNKINQIENLQIKIKFMEKNQALINHWFTVHNIDKTAEKEILHLKSISSHLNTQIDWLRDQKNKLLNSVAKTKKL